MVKNAVEKQAGGRTKKGTNLYLPADLVQFGTQYAENKFRSSRNPKGKPLSFLVESILLKLKRAADKKAALAKPAKRAA